MAESVSVTTMLGAAGACPEIALDGKTWRIGHPSQRSKPQLEKLVVAHATAEILALEGLLEPAQFARFFESHKSDVISGTYRTWGAGWQKIALAPANIHMFLLALLRENHPEATEKDARALIVHNRHEVELALAQTVPAFFTLLMEDLPLTAEQRRDMRAKIQAITSQLRERTPPTSAG